MVLMGKHGSTKEEILRQISQGSDNLSAISEALGLAPSTVSKHIHDLEAAGMIEQRDNPHVKKWKYYQLKQDAHARKESGSRALTSRSAITAALALVVIAIIAFASYGLNQNAAYSGAYKSSYANYVPISITDPPQVPAGTQALYINYSHLYAQVTNSSSRSWVSVSASGRLDLMSLINESQVIGSIGIGPNSSIDSIRFNITAASITIDNITYPVYLTIGEVTAKVGSTKLNDSSGVLLDFSPAVMPAYASNSTIFALVPALRAAIVPRPGQSVLAASAQSVSGSFGAIAAPSAPMINGMYPLSANDRDVLAKADSNLSITNATLYSADNTTSLSVVIKNSGTDNVTVMGVVLYGDLTPYPVAIPMAVNGTASVNMSGAAWSGHGGPEGNALPQANASGNKSDLARFPDQHDSSHLEINASTMYTMWARHGANSINIRLPRPVSSISISDVGKAFGSTPGYINMPDRFRMMSMGISFMVDGNGTLSLPHPPFYNGKDSEPGYLLQGHSASALSYSGKLTALDASPPLVFANGTSYRLVVITNEGPVQTNFTAT
jgi:DNA-binding transcriptional ArsR family regulator